MITGFLRTLLPRCPGPLTLLPALVAIAAFLAPAAAQYGPKPLLGPGDKVPPELLLGQGGQAGRDLAPLIGRGPVLIVYWRPGDPVSEQCLSATVAKSREIAPTVPLFVVGILAANQSPEDFSTRLQALGLEGVISHQDGGQMASIIGVRKVPSFALIDSGGILREVGGSDLAQLGAEGTSIAEALELAAKGAPVPTLGVLATERVYRLLGKPVPDAAGTENDGKTWRKVSALLAPGKRTLLIYWSPTCSHCKVMLPKLRMLYETRKNKDVEVVTIGRADAPALRNEAASFLKDYPWTKLLDMDASITRALMVQETPTAFLVGSDGKIAGIQVGATINWEKWLAPPSTPGKSS